MEHDPTIDLHEKALSIPVLQDWLDLAEHGSQEKESVWQLSPREGGLHALRLLALPLAKELVELREWATQSRAALTAAEKSLARMIDTLNDKGTIVGGSGSALAEVRAALAAMPGGSDG